MRVRDITEYGSSGPYAQAASAPMAGGNQPMVTTPGKPDAGVKKPQIPLRAKTLKPIKTPKDLPQTDNPDEPFGIYDPKDKKLVGIAINQGGNKPPAILDPKTKKPLRPGWAMLRSLGVDPSTTKTESVWSKFMKLPLDEQLRIVEHIEVNKLNRIIAQE